MGTYVDGQYLPALAEIGYDDEVNANFRRLGDLGLNAKAPPYNAVGDGVADDTVELQALLDANGSQGGAHVIPGGVYGISDTLNIGHHLGTQSNSLKLLGATGALGTHQSNSNKAVWLKALPTFPTDGRPMMLVQNIHGTTLEGINFEGNRRAGTLLKITHSTGDQNPHNILVDSCTFRGALTYGTEIGSATVADEADADVCSLMFFRCSFNHAAVDGANSRAHVRGTSENALPVSFYGCEFAGERTSAAAGVDYHFELTGGTYNIFGALTAGADVSVFLYNVNPIGGLNQVPPNVSVVGVESQGDYSFIRWDYSTSRSTSAGQRPTTLEGVYVGDDGTGFHADSIQWDGQGWEPLALTGVKLQGNLNVVNTGAFVFVHGLLFNDSTGAVTGQVGRVSGSWYDGSAGQDKYHMAAGQGGLTLNETTTAGFAPAANSVVIFAEDDGAGKTRLMARFPTGATQQIAIQP